MPQLNQQKSIENLLNDYESINTIHTSENWEEQLLAKINSRKKTSSFNIKKSVLLFCLLLVNGILFYQLNQSNVGKHEKRTELLLNVSEQLLIQSTALK